MNGATYNIFLSITKSNESVELTVIDYLLPIFRFCNLFMALIDNHLQSQEDAYLRTFIKDQVRRLDLGSARSKAA